MLCFEAHGDDFADELHDVVRFVFAVRVVGNGATGVGVGLVLVDHPFQRATVAEAVGEAGFGDAGEGEEVVIDKRGLVLVSRILSTRQFSFSSGFSMRFRGYSAASS